MNLVNPTPFFPLTKQAYLNGSDRIMLRGLKRFNRYENRILKLAKLGKKKIKILQLGYSRKSKDDFRFPIYGLELGKQNIAGQKITGFIAGVHGLETIGIRVLFDFLEHIFYPGNESFLPELHSGKLKLVCIPILNPAGVVFETRSNGVGVDLMRNSKIDAKKSPLFFGGHRWTPSLPYYRGKALQPESKILFKFIKKYFYGIENSILPVLDIHSGFGTIDNFWWPFAYTKEKCKDDSTYQNLAKILRDECFNLHVQYGPQSESYTTHGDLWDQLYLNYQEFSEQKPTNSKFLPWTLEIGTWSDLKSDPWKILRKRGIFNPAKVNKYTYIKNYRNLLRDFARLALLDPNI